MSGHNDELHLPHGSIWPICIAFSIALLGVGIFTNLPLLILGLLAMTISLVGWFREDIKWWNEKVGTGDAPAKNGVLFFMSSELFLFGALFATYFSLKGGATSWPDTHFHVNFPLVLFFTAILVSSSFTLSKAEKELAKDNRQGFIRWLTTTVILGTVFLGGQVNEYMELIHSGFTFGSGSDFSAMFFMITGTHGLHVFGGLLVLFVVLIRALKGQFNSERHLLPQVAGWYWHFVDAIWIIVLAILYVPNLYF